MSDHNTSTSSGRGLAAGFEPAFDKLLNFLIYLVGASIGLITVLIPCNLLLIKMRWGNLWWLHEAVEYALYVGVFLGAPWVLRQGAHVRVDVLTAALPARTAARLDNALNLFGAALCVLLCVYGARMMVSEFQDGTLPDKDLRIPTWYMMLVFSVSFLLLAVEFLLRMRRARERPETGQAKTSESGF